MCVCVSIVVVSVWVGLSVCDGYCCVCGGSSCVFDVLCVWFCVVWFVWCDMCVCVLCVSCVCVVSVFVYVFVYVGMFVCVLDTCLWCVCGGCV